MPPASNNNNNNRRLVTLAEHTSDHGKPPASTQYLLTKQTVCGTGCTVLSRDTQDSQVDSSCMMHARFWHSVLHVHVCLRMNDQTLLSDSIVWHPPMLGLGPSPTHVGSRSFALI